MKKEYKHSQELRRKKLHKLAALRHYLRKMAGIEWFHKDDLTNDDMMKLISLYMKDNKELNCIVSGSGDITVKPFAWDADAKDNVYFIANENGKQKNIDLDKVDALGIDDEYLEEENGEYYIPENIDINPYNFITTNTKHDESFKEYDNELDDGHGNKNVQEVGTVDVTQLNEIINNMADNEILMFNYNGTWRSGIPISAYEDNGKGYLMVIDSSDEVHDYRIDRIFEEYVDTQEAANDPELAECETPGNSMLTLDAEEIEQTVHELKSTIDEQKKIHIDYGGKDYYFYPHDVRKTKEGNYIVNGRYDLEDSDTWRSFRIDKILAIEEFHKYE